MKTRKLWAVAVVCCAISAQGLQVADSLVVDLDTAKLSLNNGDAVRSWANPGTAGGVFTNLIAGKGPIYQTDIAGATGVTFQAYNSDSVMTNMAPVPDSICGTNTWSMEAWVFNPSLSQTEIVFSWTARNKWPVAATGSCFEFRYGADTGNAVEHNGNNIPWYTSPAPNLAPATGVWHYVACTRDMEGRERLYVDGQMRTLTTPQVMRIRTDGVFALGTVRDYAYTNTAAYQAWASPFSGSISKLRVHKGTLSEAQVYANFSEERAAFKVKEPSDSVWAAAPGTAAMCENAANWAGGVFPSNTGRVWIANGSTAVLNTAVGDIGRFLPFHGGLILSNNASFIASPWQNNNVHMGNYTNNVFNLAIRQGSFTILDYTNANHLYFGVNRGQAYGVIGGGAGPAILDGGRDVQLGVNDGSVSRLTIEEGGQFYTSNGWIYVGCSGIADSKLTVNGGFVGHRRTGLDLVISHNNAYGVLEVNGGVVAPSQDLQFTRDGNARCYGALQLNGGLVQARNCYANNTSGTNVIFMNGGTLRNRSTVTNFIYNLDWVYVQPGGAKFDVLPYTAVATGQPLLTDPNLGDGGLTKSGDGLLYLVGANTFTGNIAVVGGHLCLSNSAGLVAGYAGKISVTAGASIGYATAGGANALLSHMDTASAGGLTLYSENAAENVDLTAFPSLAVGFANGVTYTGTLTPYNLQYKFSAVSSNLNVYGAVIADGATAASVALDGLPYGVIELTGNNSFTGGTVINGGILSMGHANALGPSGSILIKRGAALRLNASGIASSVVSRIDPASEGAILLCGPCAGLSLDVSALPLVRVGTDTQILTATGTITPANNEYRLGGGRLPYASSCLGLIVTNLSNNGATPRRVVIDEPGMVCPSNATHSGGTIVTNSGVLQLRWDSGLGAAPAAYDPSNLVVNGAVLRSSSLGVTLNSKRGITVGPDGMTLHPWGSTTFTVPGGLHGAGAITNTDSGSVWFSGPSNTYSGAITLNSGTIGIGGGTTFTWNTNAVFNGNGGTMGVNSDVDVRWSTQIGRELGVGGLASVGLYKTGRGTLTVDVPQSYLSTTTINQGTLKAGVAGAVPSGSSRGTLQLNNLNYVPVGMLDVNGFVMDINGLSGAGCVTDSTATATQILVNDNNHNTTFNGAVAPTLKTVKIGSGALNLLKGARLNDLEVRGGAVTNNPGGVIAGTATLLAGTVLSVGGLTNEVNGLLGEYYDFSVNSALYPYATVTTLVSLAKLNQTLEPFAPATVICSGPVSNVFSFGASGNRFQNVGNYRVARWTGKFLAETTGVYKFDSASDDGSMVFVDGVTVVSNNFSQGYGRNAARLLTPITLTSGWHDIVVAYYNGTGSYGLTVFMTPPGGTESELPQRLLRPAYAKVGALAGDPLSTLSFYSLNAGLEVGSSSGAGFDGLVVGTNALNAIKKIGAGTQTLKRLAFQGSADVAAGTLALQGSPMYAGAVQSISGGVFVAQGATLGVRSYSPDWPNAGLAGAYYEIANFGNSTFASLSGIASYFVSRTPNNLLGTHLAGSTVLMSPYTLFPAPYSNGFQDFIALYQGRIVIREAGTYGFYLNSDDRSDLYLDGVQVVSNAVAGTARSGSAYLTAGSHDLLVPYQQGGGGYSFYVNWTPPGGTSVGLPNAVLRPCVAMTGPLAGAAGAAVSLADKGSYLFVNETTNTTFAGSFSGLNGSEIEKGGPMTFSLTGSNDAFLGSWFVSQGELVAGDGAVGGTLGGSNAYVSAGATLTFNRSDDVVYAGDIAGNGTVRSLGAGKVKLLGNLSGFTGTLQINAGQQVTIADVPGTNAVINNNGTLELTGPLAALDAARIVGSGTVRISSSATLSLGSAPTSYANELVVSNGVLALAVTNASSAWHFGRVTLYAGTGLEVGPSGVWGKYYDIAYDTTTVSNAFRTYDNATNYFATKSPALVASTWLQTNGLDFGSAGALFPGKYKSNAVNFAAQYVGKICITEPGAYTFSVSSDDNGIIYIDGQVVANGNYNKGIVTKSGTVTLAAGLHDFALFYAQGTGGYGLYADITFPGQTSSQRIPNAMLVAPVADAPAYALAVDTIAVTNGPGTASVTMGGQGVLKMTDLWIDGGAKLAVTGAVACAGATLTATVPAELPRGVTVLGDFTGTGGLDVSGVDLRAVGTDGALLYRNKKLYVSRPNGTTILVR